MKKRVTINLSSDLHALAVEHAKEVHYTDLSGLVTMLIADDLRATTPIKKKESGRFVVPDQQAAKVRNRARRFPSTYHDAPHGAPGRSARLNFRTFIWVKVAVWWRSPGP